MRVKKIAIFSGTIPSSSFVEHLIKGLSSDCQIYLFGVVKSSVDYESKNIKVYKTPQSHYENLALTVVRLLRLLFKSPISVWKLYKLIKSYRTLYDKWIWFTKFLPIVLHRPDIFHIQWARDVEFYGFLKEQFGIKIIVSLLGSHINYTPVVEPRMALLYRQFFPKVDAFHAVSEAIAKEAQLYQADKDKIKLIHTTLNPLLPNTFEYRPIGKSKLKILSIGRHHWVKGYRYALLASHALKTKDIDFDYTIIAPGEAPEALFYLRKDLGLTNRVKFQNEINQLELFDYMKQFDILVLPSLSEGIANVVLEAMVLGIPVVSTNCGGMPEVVKPKETGWLVPVRDSEALALAVEEMINTSEEELKRITQNAYDFVKMHFDAEDSIQQFLELYEGVVRSE